MPNEKVVPRTKKNKFSTEIATDPLIVTEMTGTRIVAKERVSQLSNATDHILRNSAVKFKYTTMLEYGNNYVRPKSAQVLFCPLSPSLCPIPLVK